MEHFVTTQRKEWKTAFDFDAFEDTFRQEVAFDAPTMVDGLKRLHGKSRLIELDLTAGPHGRLRKATLIFPFFLKQPDLNRQVTAQVTRFLELCLPDRVPPEQWMKQATLALKSSENKAYTSEHGGILLSLVLMKPDLIFTLQAERGDAPRP